MAAKAESVHAKMDRRISQEEREAAAAQLAELMDSTTGIAPAAVVADPPGPGGIPDYFSSTPNWAYSPELRKFVDGLPGVGPENANNLGQYLSVAHPDTTTYPGSDYYEIELRQYSEQLHSDMPATLLRGYVQVNKGTDGSGKNTIVPDPIHYLGPTIMATKDRPVRIKFTNKLPINEGGDLFIPVDKSYMGAGYGPEGMMEGDPMYTENRAVVHLHGGKTVWISDGTPHQWITPAGENTPYPKGVSVQNVPDMPDPGDGSTTLFYSNQQSARMLWYHDHAYGITRLNVLVGMAAGYFITDDAEKELIDDGLVPTDQIPLIIQDKTFVDASTIATTDPTWNWGATPGTPHTGDLWFPHVYVPAQNPAMTDGVNPTGRWHYGPWFWPPAQVAKGPVANPYYDPDGSTPWENPTMPGTPDDSSGMEAFQDTPLVNGTAYPTMNVDPKAYRMRILNAASDRFWNLQMYVADPGTISCDGRRNTEVKMLPAAKTTGWPADWPVDGREGGVPDPKTAGPDWIQIGTEGGVLPNVAVIPQQPITWVTDVTLFNAGNVDKGSLIVAPAERADVIVDFSKYAGKTLIMYNDAPAAFPAGDPRYDYYTDNPDMTDTGGHAPTRAGYGPNTRTIMQIKVAAKTAAPAFDLAALQDAFTSTGAHDSVFESSQNKIIVPNDRYNSTYDQVFVKDAYVRIFETSFKFKNLDGVETTFPLEPKAIQDEQGETFDEFGRMSGKLGLERPTGVPGAPNFILYSYMDPPTEVEVAVSPDMVPLTPVMGDGTQIWKITHNGVDTHPMHFHLYDVQLINRVGWDGFMRYPDENELGWKDTVRVSPLEDTIVALRPVAPTAPFNVPDSVRPLDPTQEIGGMMMFSTIDPVTGQPYDMPIMNEVRNFGWEYVWHCHILSHEEMDMMRPVTVEVASLMPEAPVLDPATIVSPGTTALTWVDGTPAELASTWGNLANEIGFRVQRAPIVASVVGEYSTIATALANQTSFKDDTIVLGEEYSYQVIAYNQEGTATSTPVAIGPIVDDTAPMTTSNVDGMWHQQPFSVTLVATDTLSGVASTSYKLDAGATMPYSASFDVSGEGTHTLEFWSEDNLGAVESTNTATVKIDNTAPVTTDNHLGSYTGSATVALSATDPLSGVAKTYYKLDGGATVAGASVKTSTQGSHSLEYWSEDAAGNVESPHTIGFAVLPANATYMPLEGPNRLQTALEISRATFPLNSVDTVVIASSDAWPDALVGASLAGAYQSPILLTSPTMLSSGLSTEITRLGASKAVILGSTASVGTAAENSLKTLLGASNVTRIGGVDRYDTARLVAAETVKFFDCNFDGTAIVTTGLNFPDALAAGPLASAKGWPIYLVRPTGIGAANAAAMNAAGVTKALVLGSTAAAPASVTSDITSMVGATVTRLEGPNRYATAVKIAEYGVANAGLKWDGVAIATGQNFPDGLAAGAAQGYNRSVLLLTPTNWLAPATQAALLAHKNDIVKVRFIGSDAAVSAVVRTAVAAQLN
ncbi:MAG: laccase [Actinobacteria bacterium HGW-Actinobacteria-6]|nr:MAG: laccase [Actinobacteria bacterium HGW-Actinobacteria-6]